MFAPKPISSDSVPGALAKAERYRLLNEPGEAESICLDILDVDPHNQQALISLVLAQTDQLSHVPRACEAAFSTAARLESEYDRAYYTGIVWERRAKARHSSRGPGGHEYVYEWLLKAMDCFEKAEALRPVGNDDAVLRWNACARFLNVHRDLRPRHEEAAEPILSE